MEDRLASKNIRLCDEAKQQNRTMSKSKCKTELHYDYLIVSFINISQFFIILYSRVYSMQHIPCELIADY